MKPNAPMSTLSTNNIINHCLDEEFSYNSIKNVRHNIYTDNLEAVVELSKNGCRYISGKFDQPNQWKLEWILFFINSVILKHKLDKNGDLFSINKRQQEFAKIVLDIKTQEQYLANVLTRYNSIYNS